MVHTRRSERALARGSRQLVLLTALGTGCAGSDLAADLARPPEYNPGDRARCAAGVNVTKPFVVEWPSADRAELEARATRGPVAVRYADCEMEILRSCQVPGRYAYTGVTRQDDRLKIKSTDELFAKIPIHAASLQAKLQKAGELNVDMSIVGTYALDRGSVRAEDLQGECSRATHVVSGLTIGAFEFFAGASAQISATADVVVAEAEAKGGAERETLNRGGDRAACGRAGKQDQGPPEGCGALIRVEVVPVLTANPFANIRRWRGTYVCPQGPSKIELLVDEVAGDQIRGTLAFAFEPKSITGKFHVRGTYKAGSRELTVVPGEWIDEVEDWTPVGFTVKVDEAGQTLSGKMDSADCGGITLQRAP
jgi:hypothetical protein